MILNQLARWKIGMVEEWDDYLEIMRKLRWYRLQNLNTIP